MVPEECRTRYTFHSAVGKEVVGKYAGEHRAYDTAEAVGREHVERIIKKVARFLPGNCKVAADGDDEGDEYRLANAHPACAGSDSHKSYYGADCCAHGRRLMAAQCVEYYPCHHRRGGRSVGVEECRQRYSVGGKRTTTVETEPSQPQQGRTKQHEWHIGRLGMLRRGAAAQEHSSRQRCDARRCVYHDAARKVMYMKLAEQALRMPRTVGQRTVYQYHP